MNQRIPAPGAASSNTVKFARAKIIKGSNQIYDEDSREDDNWYELKNIPMESNPMIMKKMIVPLG